MYWRQGDLTALRHGDWKILRMGKRSKVGDAKWELKHLSSDLSEESNWVESEPLILRDLIERWETMDQEMVDPLF